MRVRLLSVHVAFLVVLGWSSSAWAQCYVYGPTWSGVSADVGTFSSCSAAADVVGPAWASEHGYSGVSGLQYVAQPAESDVPTAAGQGCAIQVENSSGGGFGGSSAVSEAGTCTGPCSSNQGKHAIVVSNTGAAQTEGSSQCDGSGCMVTMDSPSGSFTPTGQVLVNPFVIVQTPHGPAAMQSAMITGQSCTPASNASTQGQLVSTGAPAVTCEASAGVTVCATQDVQGHNCGTYNGDSVCVAAVSPGTCAGFASGGVVCQASSPSAAVQSPPAPNDGTAGTPATPDATVQDSAGTVNYYSSGTVAHSSTGTGTGTVTQGASVAGNNTGVVIGGASAASAGGSGDCDAPSSASTAGCEGTLPAQQTPECSSYSQCFQNFWTNVQGAPIFAAVSAISNAWPTGSCPTEQVTLGTEMNNAVLDYGSPLCNVWENSALPILEPVTLAFFALVAVFIVMSA